LAERRYQLSSAGALLGCLLIAACGTMPAGDGRPGDTEQPTAADEPERVLRPVSQSLLQQSREQQRYGNYAQAAATLERAIRIDPGEPAVWLELARVRYAENNWPQAEQLARKARSLSGAGSQLRAGAARIIADALRMQGRPQEAEELQDFLQ
jgi:Flp pilus assembly protein TadD